MSELFDDLTANEDGSRSNAEGVIVHRPWMAQNPDDLKVNEGLAKFKTTEDVSRAIMDFDGKMGELKNNTIPKLGDNPTDEAKAAHRTALGVPDTVEGYADIKKPDDLPEGLEYDQGLEGVFKNTAHALGLNPAQAKGVSDAYNAHVGELFTKAEEVRVKMFDDSVNALKNVWGAEHEGNIEKAKRALDTLSEGIFKGDSFKKFMEESGLGNYPQFLQLFHGIHAKISDDTWETGSTNTNKDKRPIGPDGKPALQFKDMPGTTG